ncbi:hypothetical protein QUF74_00175 [Candidatus Halobeggiatoa sp. HSG11]|nr:hypothetical protein [Candidatus Halobeggiatoa sp. HSG11]
MMQQQIETYLADETKLYQEWFAIYNPPIDGVDGEIVKFAETESLDSLKKRFATWFDSQEKALRKIICEEWGYNKKTFENKLALITAIAIDCLVVTYELSTANTITIATILVADGYLERLCPETEVKS